MILGWITYALMMSCIICLLIITSQQRRHLKAHSEHLKALGKRLDIVSERASKARISAAYTHAIVLALNTKPEDDK